MKRFIMLMALLGVVACASLASAETNGQQQANSDVARSSSQALSAMVQGRVATIAAPKSPVLKQTSHNYIDQKGNFAFSMDAEDLGLSAGDGGNTFGVWGMGSYTNFKSTASGARYDADAYNLLVGFDWRATSDLLVGVAGGYGTLDLDKKGWNNGADTGSIKTDHEWTVMPYVAYNITDTTIVDAAFALTDSRYKDNDGTNTGKYDSTRYLTNIGISQYYMVDAWTLSGRIGYMYVHGDMGHYSRGGTNVANPDNFLGQLNLEAKAAYAFSNGFEPYAGLRYFYDTTTSVTPVDSDYDEFEGLLGVNWYASDQWTLSVEGGASAGRSKYESYRGQANIRYEF